MILHPESDGPYKDVLLYSLHPGEGYDALFRDPKYRKGFARSFLTIDFYHMHQAGLEVNPQWNTLLGDQFSYLEYTDGCLYTVSGDMQAHAALFLEFFHDLVKGPQGGDDDTFDYWPGAVDMFIQYAADLTDLGNDSVLALCRELGRRNKDVMEFEDMADMLINLH